eukprot:1097022-Pyramimonas_sp.AAC.1
MAVIRGAFSSWVAESSDTIRPSPIAMRTIVPAAGQASGSREADGSNGVYPAVPDGWGDIQGTQPIPIALNGQIGKPAKIATNSLMVKTLNTLIIKYR